MSQRRRTREDEDRSPAGIAAGRSVRIWVVSSLMVAVLLGGAGTLWFLTAPADPRPAASRIPAPARPAAEPPIRLDTLPAPRSSERQSEARTSAKAVPVIGVGTDEFSGESSGEVDEEDVTVDVDGQGKTEEIASDAQIKRELAALARENARIEAALSGAQGAASGTGELIWPVRGPVTSPFGQRWGRLHAGIDIGVPTGTPVRASDSGRVAVSGPVGGYGNYICVQHTRSLSTCYAHNSRLGVRKGESVRKGQVIASSGCTGRCYGPHVHFEVREGGRPVNPRSYL